MEYAGKTVRGVVKPKNLIPWLIGLAVFSLSGVGIAYFSHWYQPAKEDITDLTVPVTTSNLKIKIKTNGVVQPVRKINIGPREAGKIAKLYVDEGSSVYKGQLVAEMERQAFQAQVNQYRAMLLKAKADLQEKRKGYRPEEIAIAQADVHKYTAQVREAQSRLVLATQRVQRRQYPVSQGAISRDDLDTALNEEKSTKDNLQQAKFSLISAQQQLKKLLSGYQTEEITKAAAEVAQATAQLQFYETQLENTYIRAPFSGLITRRFAQAGDFVTPNTSVSTNEGGTSASIAELASGLEIEAKVPEVNMAKIKQNQPVEIRLDAFPEQVFQGKVRLIAPRGVKEENVTFMRVKVALATGQDQLKVGLNVKLTFLVNDIPNALVIPSAAVISGKEGQVGVLLLDKDNQAKFYPVQVGITSGDKTQILSGLSQGERVFIQPPPNQLIDGIDNQMGS
ncbi:efflux RND transporter periplasmic adaptor subunit [Dolichospermum sp. ST_sed1]|nr:efflux RND transporter periplasmic adaptor subunit [Dolichospermum sp. ST_sed1]MDD1426757.1 efflux RND transporter periplasmic adaptor subunit [Dolichospermum sp. ST_sed9]MDD1433357.1 efflux RND transporter periplasmic adaptor subunit [Dolichospermum sp. ST_sed6]MDD1436542.1 efflux RND transporter periplasmic adaptor subunit [Dolichospermum sp. ST_sed10]MDD1442616.1 efflux RND transporter periplasmic adaptor subunit [Dolichospermum sp. ST_sed3]MDD1448264.1 efflux RND transporter periplasmic